MQICRRDTLRIRRCWAPAPARPVVCNGYEHQFVYVYGAVSPVEGQHDWMITDKMKTTTMSKFLAHVSKKHRSEFMVMVVVRIHRRATPQQVGQDRDGPVFDGELPTLGVVD